LKLNKPWNFGVNNSCFNYVAKLLILLKTHSPLNKLSKEKELSVPCNIHRSYFNHETFSWVISILNLSCPYRGANFFHFRSTLLWIFAPINKYFCLRSLVRIFQQSFTRLVHKRKGTPRPELHPSFLLQSWNNFRGYFNSQLNHSIGRVL